MLCEAAPPCTIDVTCCIVITANVEDRCPAGIIACGAMPNEGILEGLRRKSRWMGGDNLLMVGDKDVELWVPIPLT
jgi:hypothetical protein